MYRYRFSIFTAQYGHCDWLYERVYKSLLTQSFKNFEWIIINDGSPDETDEIVEKILDEGKLNIRYYKKNNGGKHTAWRMAIPLFEGQYVIALDNDDLLMPNALAIFDKHWKELENLPEIEYSKYWEVKCRCVNSNNQLLGLSLPQFIFDSDYNTLMYKYNFMHELQGCRKVEILSSIGNIPDEFIYEKYAVNFPEGIRWSRVARKYKTRFVDEIVRVFSDTPDSISRQQVSLSARYQTLIYWIYRLLEQRDLIFRYRPFWYFKHIAVIVYCSKNLRISLTDLQTPKNEHFKLYDKVFMILAYIPVSILHYLLKNKY